MDRADLATYLDANYPDVKTAAQLSTWDAVIDNALVGYGVALADIDTWDDSAAAPVVLRTLAEWYALDRLLNWAVVRPTVSVGNPATRKNNSDIYKMAEARQARIGERLAALGYSQEGMYIAEIVLNYRAIDSELVTIDE